MFKYLVRKMFYAAWFLLGLENPLIQITSACEVSKAMQVLSHTTYTLRIKE